MPMAEPKNESLHLLGSLSFLRLARSFVTPGPFFLSVSSLLTFTLLSGPRVRCCLCLSVLSLAFASVSHGAHACMHGCMHAFRSEDGSTRFRPGSRLSFSSRRREPQLVKKLPDRLGARRADSAVVYDPTPNTLSLPCAGTRLLYTERAVWTPSVFLLRCSPVKAESCARERASASILHTDEQSRIFTTRG